MKVSEILQHVCDLCGLPISNQVYCFDTPEKPYRFCCKGCQQVFIMLLEASDAADPASFRQTELFKKCQDMGIIPRSKDERGQQIPLAASKPIDDLTKLSDPAREEFGQNALNLVLKINDMWCPACAWIIEEALKKTKGIIHAACNFSTDRLRCTYDPVMASPNQVVTTLEKLGYSTTDIEAGDAKVKNTDFIRFTVSAFLTVNVMMFSFALYTGFFTELTQDTVFKLSWPIFFMASIVLFYGGRNIYQKAFAGLISAVFGMETLITAGAFSAYVYSCINLFSGSIHLYYDTVSMLITLVLAGKALERHVRDKVQFDLDSFFSLEPKKVKICSPLYPQGRYTHANQLKPGDIFQITESELVPADGHVIEGAGAVDESMLTGEALPVFVKPNDRVRSGTTVIRGTLRVKADSVGENSIWGQMIKIIEQTLNEKTPLEGRTDKILQWFVPVILTLSMATGFFFIMMGLPTESALIRAVTVMVISCPCALGIAIPMARVAGISVAGKKGILIRSFSCFEQLPRMDSIVFDKTGTITQGKWKLRNIFAVPPYTENEVLTIAASLEGGLDHTIAMEIRRNAENKGLKAVKVNHIQIFDNGISGFIDHDRVKIGSKDFLFKELQESGFSYDENIISKDPAVSPIFMSRKGKICAVFMFGDQLRSTAIEAVNHLRTMGYRMYLISGDGTNTTRVVGEKIGIRCAYGNKLPREKALFIQKLQKMGQTVAMVGDGINDAPALVQADLAVAVHSGGHPGKDVADIILMRGEPLQIIEFIDLAKGVNKKIWQNLISAFGYNIISIPMAMSGLLNPLIAVCAMLLSSLSVIGNTLLFIRKMT